jgi:hypothetical protein
VQADCNYLRIIIGSQTTMPGSISFRLSPNCKMKYNYVAILYLQSKRFKASELVPLLH